MAKLKLDGPRPTATGLRLGGLKLDMPRQGRPKLNGWGLGRQ